MHAKLLMQRLRIVADDPQTATLGWSFRSESADDHGLLYATDQSSQCVDCHSKATPNIVSDWKLSKHSQVEVSCVSCHGDQHMSATDVAKVKMPTPDTCVTCH